MTKIDDIDERVKTLEGWKICRNTQEAVRKEQDKSNDKRFMAVEKQIADIKGWFSRIVWTVIGSIILAFIAFIIKGGLTI